MFSEAMWRWMGVSQSAGGICEQCSLMQVNPHTPKTCNGQTEKHALGVMCMQNRQTSLVWVGEASQPSETWECFIHTRENEKNH